MTAHDKLSAIIDFNFSLFSYFPVQYFRFLTADSSIATFQCYSTNLDSIQSIQFNFALIIKVSPIFCIYFALSHSHSLLLFFARWSTIQTEKFVKSSPNKLKIKRLKRTKSYVTLTTRLIMIYFIYTDDDVTFTHIFLMWR